MNVIIYNEIYQLKVRLEFLYVNFSEWLRQIDIELDQKSRIELSVGELLKGVLQMYAAMEELDIMYIT